MFCGFVCVITNNMTRCFSMIIVKEIKRNKSTLRNMAHIINSKDKNNVFEGQFGIFSATSQI